MSTAGWLVLAALAAGVVWLGLALIGAVRALEEVRERVDTLEGRPAPSRRPLPVGSPAPAWRISTADGEVVSSSTFESRRHLLLFADAGCRACDDLVPEVVRSAAAGSVPPVAIVGRDDPSATPAAWRRADVRVRVGAERGGEVSDAFGVDVTPTAVVIDEGGAVVARAPVATMDDVRALLRESNGVRIVVAGGA
jgi:redoxin